jgi:RimJ/RimL family protein N-acetyltransferase
MIDEIDDQVTPPKRVALREVRESDFPVIFKWLNDYELRISSAMYRPVSWLEHIKWITARLEDGSETFFVMTLEDRPIGVVNLSSIDSHNRSADFSIRIGESSDRGRGYGTQAVQLLIDFCWRDMNLHRLSLTVFSDNSRAIKSYLKSGFEFEGELRDAAFISGTWRNLTVMSILNPNN